MYPMVLIDRLAWILASFDTDSVYGDEHWQTIVLLEIYWLNHARLITRIRDMSGTDSRSFGHTLKFYRTYKILWVLIWLKVFVYHSVINSTAWRGSSREFSVILNLLEGRRLLNSIGTGLEESVSLLKLESLKIMSRSMLLRSIFFGELLFLFFD